MRRPAIARANFHADKGGGWWFLHSRSRRHFRSVEVSSCFTCARRGEVFILVKRGAISLSRFRPRRQPYFGGSEGQSCQASHLPLLRQGDCRNFAPLERGRLDSKPLFCPFSGSANFLCCQNGAAYFPSAPGILFPLSRRIPAPLRLSPPPRFKIRALGLSFRKKQDIIAVYLVTKESKGFLN